MSKKYIHVAAVTNQWKVLQGARRLNTGNDQLKISHRYTSSLSMHNDHMAPSLISFILKNGGNWWMNGEPRLRFLFLTIAIFYCIYVTQNVLWKFLKLWINKFCPSVFVFTSRRKRNANILIFTLISWRLMLFNNLVRRRYKFTLRCSTAKILTRMFSYHTIYGSTAQINLKLNI